MREKFRIHRILFYLFFFLPVSLIYPNTNIIGYILDAQTKKPLAAANVELVGTFQGTISNEDGKYYLELKKLPITVIVSYIGYQSKSLTIKEDSPRRIDVLLKPIILETEPIVVIAEDPAIAIMRKVIQQKQKWMKNLDTYKASAYSRLVIENDSGIVSISESISDAFWDREKGPREVIKSKRQSNNLSENQNFAFASYIPNFYDDDIQIIGYEVIGPTHPDAFDYYDFKLDEISHLDNKTVFLIRVIPISKLQPTFVGKLSVLDSAFALLDIQLKPNKTILFPPPIDSLKLSYQQQFRNFGTEYWLPVDYRVKGIVKIGFTGLEFPGIIYKRITALTEYEVNIELPDSLYREEKFLSIDSLAIEQDTVFASSEQVIPLSVKEEDAYDSLDSTMTLEKAFKPSGFLARLIEVRSGDREKKDGEGGLNLLSKLNPQIWFNRVDAWHLGVSFNTDLLNNLDVQLYSAYNTGTDRWAYGTLLEYKFTKKRDAWVTIDFHENTESRYKSPTFSMTVASLGHLLGQDDYFDYYWNKSFSFKAGIAIKPINSAIKIAYNDQRHGSLEKTSDFNIVWSNYKQRPNPEIQEGNLRSLQLNINYGSNYIPFGVIGQSRVDLEIEHCSPDILPSDFSFTRYQLAVDWRINTFLTRRLLPNALDIQVIAGTSQGDLPLQRFMSVDANLIGFSPFGVLKSLNAVPYEGEKYLAVFWEHNFRTVPFELLGFDLLVDKGIGVILHGALGRTWISDSRLEELNYTVKYIDRIHSEIGLSINGIFGLLRIDATQRLDKNIFHLGFGLTRYF
jgi:hypothetical protein